MLISALFGMFSVEAVHVDPWLVLQPNVDVALEFAGTIGNFGRDEFIPKNTVTSQVCKLSLLC